MKHYINEDGTFHCSSNKTFQLEEVPAPPSAPYQVWNGGEWIDGSDPRSYRDKRRESYKLMGQEPGFEDAVGDILDATFKYIMRTDPNAINDPDLGVILAKIVNIKTQFPKDEEE